MRILIDNSNLFAGGGIQVAVSLLNDLKKIETLHEFIVLQPTGMKGKIEEISFDSKFTFVQIDENRSQETLKLLIKITKQQNRQTLFFTSQSSIYKLLENLDDNIKNSVVHL